MEGDDGGVQGCKTVEQVSTFWSAIVVTPARPWLWRQGCRRLPIEGRRFGGVHIGGVFQL